MFSDTWHCNFSPGKVMPVNQEPKILEKNLFATFNASGLMKMTALLVRSGLTGKMGLHSTPSASTKTVL